LEEKLKNSRGDKYLCQNVFQGEKANLKVCGGCGNKSETLEPFLFQQVQVQQKASILDGLENTIKGEIISDYQCDACNERVELTKRSVIK
jgi:ubiquitin carboxyl-terminal hydrolase 34